jgi:hypothetical protein
VAFGRSHPKLFLALSRIASKTNWPQLHIRIILKCPDPRSNTHQPVLFLTSILDQGSVPVDSAYHAWAVFWFHPYSIFLTDPRSIARGLLHHLTNAQWIRDQFWLHFENRLMYLSTTRSCPTLSKFIDRARVNEVK